MAIGVAVSSGTLVITWPERVYAYTLEVLDDNEANSLLQMIQRIFPHGDLDKAYYGAVVEVLDSEATASSEAATTLKLGISDLDKAAGERWLDLTADEQTDILKGMQQHDLFQTVLGKGTYTIYNNPEVWAKFGYEGPSFDKGGYLERGFNDLDWLPKPPESASPLK